MDWTKAYESGFSIGTDSPSEVVVNGLGKAPYLGVVLDIGCGDGRNSLYAARIGHTVQSFDVVDRTFLKDSGELAKRISFARRSFTEVCLNRSFYIGAIMTRFLQYVSPENLDSLVQSVSGSLKSRGVLMLSYTFEGGVLEGKEVLCWKHSPDDILDLIETNHLRILEERKVQGVSPLAFGGRNLMSHEIIAQKR